jgi:hypothetical protein
VSTAGRDRLLVAAGVVAMLVAAGVVAMLVALVVVGRLQGRNLPGGDAGGSQPTRSTVNTDATPVASAGGGDRTGSAARPGSRGRGR